MITWGYIAGFLDGDGWITKYRSSKNRYTCIAGITQNENCKYFMEQIYNFLIQNGINARFNIRKKHNWKSSLKMINITIKEQKSLAYFLRKISPFLLIKKEKCIDTLSYVDSRLKTRSLKKLPSTKNKKLWKDKDLTELLDLVKSGKTNIEISHFLKRGTQSVASKVSKLKLRIIK